MLMAVTVVAVEELVGAMAHTTAEQAHKAVTAVVVTTQAAVAAVLALLELMG
jgi:hypothetical protein